MVPSVCRNIGPGGVSWLSDYMATLPDQLLPGQCNVQMPDVFSAVSAYLGVASGMRITFDTRLLHLGVNGRILSLEFPEMFQLQIAVEWFVRNMAHFQHVCEQCYDSPLLHHSVFCLDGHILGSSQLGLSYCVPKVY